MSGSLIYELGRLMGCILGVMIIGSLFMYGLKKWAVLFKLWRNNGWIQKK